MVGGKLQVVNKIMNAESKAYLRKIMQGLYAELNKMEGDYAPTKLSNTDSKGNDIIDYSNISTDELERRAKAKLMLEDDRN